MKGIEKLFATIHFDRLQIVMRAGQEKREFGKSSRWLRKCLRKLREYKRVGFSETDRVRFLFSMSYLIYRIHEKNR